MTLALPFLVILALFATNSMRPALNYSYILKDVRAAVDVAQGVPKRSLFNLVSSQAEKAELPEEDIAAAAGLLSSHWAEVNLFFQKGASTCD